MTTALDIISVSLAKLGVYAPGEVITDADAEYALTIFNDMLDSWSNESLSCYEVTETSFPLVVGKTTYTVGIGGDINIIRPLKLREGPGRAYSQDINGNNYQCEIIGRAKWNLINNRGPTITSNLPTAAFYQASNPFGILNVFPTPNVGGFNFFFDSDLQLVTSLSLSSIISLPVGYKKALQDNLAVELFDSFSDGQLSPKLVADAMKAKGNIKRTNKKNEESVLDPELYQSNQATYNPYTDQ